ncbi:hypothetical protein AKJ52_02615 [candidate division MSBL1 archaeon SCGC-AAA382C18]|uniref:Uncharacterized protein n=1 Tax=candidate division MSBL1 archaeon SCGC-AAA382C18 TaxID=1698281 RepID=A0A133VI01_9EURY|nr:hypothetical protein AKJ52_02615 [candidate division MSBL1 archaeon SCGC-AAA382C18]
MGRRDAALLEEGLQIRASGADEPGFRDSNEVLFQTYREPVIPIPSPKKFKNIGFITHQTSDLEGVFSTH